MKYYSGDIAVSESTVDKLMNTSKNANVELWRAFTKSKYLWDKNIVNGEYIIAYEFDPKLHRDLQIMLPKVRYRIS